MSGPFDRDRLAALADRARIDAETTSALLVCLDRIARDGEAKTLLEVLTEGLLSKPRPDAMSAVADAQLESRFGADAMLLHLAMALAEIPAGDERHRVRAIDVRISDDTWRDLSLWTSHFRERFGLLGITREILDWAQYYLRGEVYRVGALQWELRAFDGPFVALRHESTGETRLVAAADTVFTSDGRAVLMGEAARATPAAWRAELSRAEGSINGHPIDEHGQALRTRERFDAATWKVVLEPGMPMLDMHIPADARIGLPEFVEATRAARAFYARLHPDVSWHGLFGEAWLLDPQIRALLPHHAGLAAIQSACQLYPGRIPEAKTLRRIFGPDATRASLRHASRERFNSLQRAVATFLDDPSHSLRAAGGLVLNDRIAMLTSLVEGG